MPVADLPPVPLDPHVADVCVQEASRLYEVPELLIKALIEKEAGKLGQRVPNRAADGRVVSEDLGPMQVNTVWLEDERLDLQRYGISERDILWEPCINIGIGTWIARHFYEYHDGDWTRAIMSYNAGYSYENGRDYAIDVIKRWRRMFRETVDGGAGAVVMQ